MTGPEHYAKAVECAAKAETCSLTPSFVGWSVLAQAHASLAQTAATLDAVGYSNEIRNETAWLEVLE